MRATMAAPGYSASCITLHTRKHLVLCSSLTFVTRSQVSRQRNFTEHVVGFNFDEGGKTFVEIKYHNGRLNF